MGGLCSEGSGPKIQPAVAGQEGGAVELLACLKNEKYWLFKIWRWLFLTLYWP
jgi:hypothetical protein